MNYDINMLYEGFSNEDNHLNYLFDNLRAFIPNFVNPPRIKKIYQICAGNYDVEKQKIYDWIVANRNGYAEEIKQKIIEKLSDPLIVDDIYNRMSYYFEPNEFYYDPNNRQYTKEQILEGVKKFYLEDFDKYWITCPDVNLLLFNNEITCNQVANASDIFDDLKKTIDIE
jgi:hypothetical protein